MANILGFTMKSFLLFFALVLLIDFSVGAPPLVPNDLDPQNVTSTAEQKDAVIGKRFGQASYNRAYEFICGQSCQQKLASIKSPFFRYVAKATYQGVSTVLVPGVWLQDGLFAAYGGFYAVFICPFRNNCLG